MTSGPADRRGAPGGSKWIAPLRDRFDRTTHQLDKRSARSHKDFGKKPITEKGADDAKVLWLYSTQTGVMMCVGREGEGACPPVAIKGAS
jgi:hypothetical protein